jgi:hypothetical protein
MPVDGLKDSLVELTLAGRLPVFAVTQTGYIVALVVVSLVMAEFVALVAVVAVPAVAAFRFATCVVEATTNGDVPVLTVLVIWPVAETVVKAPVAGVVAPMVVELMPPATSRDLVEPVKVATLAFLPS